MGGEEVACCNRLVESVVLALLRLASHAGVFRGARISSLPTNGVCGEGRNTSSPKNDCVGGYTEVGLISFRVVQ